MFTYGLLKPESIVKLDYKMALPISAGLFQKFIFVLVSNADIQTVLFSKL